MMKRKIAIVALTLIMVCSLVIAACSKVHTATFVTNGGSEVASIETDVLQTPPLTTRGEYTFLGWYLTEDFSDAGISYPYTLTQDTTFYAKWQPPKYIVNFVPNNGQTMSAKNVYELTAAPQATRSGYTLVGWFDNAECSGNPVTFPYAVTKETTLYAKWQKDTSAQYLVNFETNGGSSVRAGLYSVITAAPETAKAGHVLLGWYDNENLSGNPVTFPYTVTGETVLYAKWEARHEGAFTVTFDTRGGNAMPPKQLEGNVLQTEPIPTYNGNYQFAGWYLTADCSGSRVTFPYTATADVTFYAKWLPLGFTLSFETNGGSPSIADKTNQVTVTENSIATVSKTGKVFGGWYLDSACTQKVVFPYTLTKNTTFYAKWDNPTVTTNKLYFFECDATVLTLTLEGGATVTTAVDTDTPIDLFRGIPCVELDVGTRITAMSSPARENAVFKGWHTTANPTDDRTKITFPYTVQGSNPVSLYAQWQVNVTPTPEDVQTLNGYFENNNPQAYVVGYGLLVKNDVSTVNQSFFQNYYSADKIISNEYLWDDKANDNKGAWVPAFYDFAFKRTDDSDVYWMTYAETDNDEGTYKFQNRWYNAETLTDLEEGFYMVYLGNMSQLDSSNFYRYNGKWYANEDYVDEAGHLLLGNASGNPSVYNINYTELALTFDADGKLTKIDVKSSVLDSFSLGTGVGVTKYYYTHDIKVWATDPTTDPDSLLNITENQFLQDQVRPNGRYPELNADDANRNNVTSDGVAYTSAQLASALAQLDNFTAYYTLAGNTFNGFTYVPVTLTVHGNYGTVKHNAYPAYTWGDKTSASQTELDDWYFRYDNNAFFLAIKQSSGYGVYCDKYSYKNNLNYNQYLLGTQASINFNPKYPVGIKYLNASNFTYVEQGGYFEFNGDADLMKQVGQSLFGDMDYVYPEAGETEHYVYLRLYMNNSKLVKVTAATQLTLFDESNEYFIKEVVITSHTSSAVTLPSGVEAQFIIPGEQAASGSVSALQTAIDATKSANHKYTDRFAYDDVDEMGGVGFYGNDERDVYVHYNGLTKVGSNLYLYFKNGKLYWQHSGADNKIEQINIDTYYKGDVEKNNSMVLWAYSIADLLSADWFYQGKDGNYYGKAEHMDKLSEAIGRYSGSEQFCEPNANSSGFSNSYRWSVVLDYVSVSVYGGKLESIYYSGVILAKGSAGQHTKPFSGCATFAYDSPSLSLPTADTADATRPAVYRYLNANYSFNVDDNGILHFDAVPNAASYKAYVYNLNNDDLVAEFAATNGMDLKTVAELNVDASVHKYRIALRAMGNGTTYLDAPASGTLAIELSTVGKLAKPTVTLNRQTASITVAGEYDQGTYYHYKILQGKVLIKEGNLLMSEALNLNNLEGVTLQPVTTYKVEIYAMGTANEIRDSETVTVSYTTDKANGQSYMNDLFSAIDYTKSFSVSLNAQDRYRYHYFEGTFDGIELMEKDFTWLNNNRSHTMDLAMYFEASLNKGKLTFNFKEYANSKYNTLFTVTFVFNKVGEQLVGLFQRTEGDAVVESKTLTTSLLFAGVKDFATDFTELSGDVHVWTHLAHRYTGNIASAETQQKISAVTALGELLGCNLTYTAMQLNMGYDSKGALSPNSCSLAVAADTDDGHSLIVSFCFSDFGENLTNKLK